MPSNNNKIVKGQTSHQPFVCFSAFLRVCTYPAAIAECYFSLKILFKYIYIYICIDKYIYLYYICSCCLR